MNALVDFYWLTGDDHQQTLRDKFAGTLVVRKDAVPAGEGPIRLNRNHFLGQSFVFYEVLNLPWGRDPEAPRRWVQRTTVLPSP
jgi:hypothetical protein